MGVETSYEEIKNLIGVKLDQGIEDLHRILDIALAEDGEFFNAYAVIAIMKDPEPNDYGYHDWAIQVHELRVDAWGDILYDSIVSENGNPFE